ncbi:PA14 domain-containing protein [Streptomyces sp. NPDC001851]|uniref:fibronectin type III domain-containing protein n=1 Tax=Streptomyces sp. NPDC001851 TaxID=3154529 RepID=UPI00332AFBD4
MNPARRVTAAAVVLATAGGLLSAVTAPASATVPCASPVYQRMFYANTTFSGTPRKTDCDSAVDQSWSGAPATGLPKDGFGVRWTVTRDFGSGGPFTFAVSGTDGIRVYLDGVREADLWSDTSTARAKTVYVTVPQGRHTLRLDYVNWTGAASVKFGYAPRTSATVDKVKPLVPTGASVTYDAATGKAGIRWAKNTEIDLAGYRVYRRLKGTSYPVRPLATTTATTYTDTTLPKTGATYYYEVRAYDRAGNESAGTADQGVTTVDTTPPAAPADAAGWSMDPVREVTLSWSANTEPDVAGYRVYRSTAWPVTTTPDNLLSGEALLRSTTWTDRPPQTGDRYFYVVTAVDTAGNESAPSGTSEYYTRDETPPTYAPDVKAEDGEHGVTLRWDWGPPGSGVSRFVVYRDGARLTEVAGTSYTDTDIARSTTHTYMVWAVDDAGNGGPAPTPVTVHHVGDYTPPPAVTGLTATAQGNGVLLDWDDSTAADVDHYEIHRGVYRDGAWTYTDITRSLPFGAVWSRNRDVSLPDGEHLRYVVVAVDGDGNALGTGDSSAVEVTELDRMPTETYSDDSGTLHMRVMDTAEGPDIDADHYGDDPKGTPTGYRVYRWDRSAGAYARLTDEPVAFDDLYRDTTAPAADTVFYKVTAVYADGTESDPVGAHVFRIGIAP